jgi:hypothetical protein
MQISSKNEYEPDLNTGEDRNHDLIPELPTCGSKLSSKGTKGRLEVHFFNNKKMHSKHRDNADENALKNIRK